MLRKDLLRVSRVGGGYHPEFVGEEARLLAERIVQTIQDHVGRSRGELTAALEEMESEAQDFKLVRGFAALLERDLTTETRSRIPPARTRRVVFDVAEAIGVADETDRANALEMAAERLGVEASSVEQSLFADREVNQSISDFDPRWTPEELLTQYNLSLAQTALFDATEIRLRSSDPRALVSAVKRNGLLYEIERKNAGREIVVTGPDSLFRRSRRYGTAFARVLRAIAATDEWTLEATIDDRGTERLMSLDQDDLTVPNVDPTAKPQFDSSVEADFAARFSSLDLDWTLLREPEPLETGTAVMIPDFSFEYEHNDRRVFFEIMGFWTPEYVEKKLGQLDALEDIELIVAVDESLGVGEVIEAGDHRVVEYSGTVRVKDVVDVLREYEAEFIAASADSLPDELVPDDPVLTLESLAARHSVGVEAIEDRDFPAHELVGRTLVRPSIIQEIDRELEPGLDLDSVEDVLVESGVDDASAMLSRLGYRVVWTGLSGGVIERRADEDL